MGEVIDVDTSAFRRAIWYYIHCLYGIMHDDYDYGQVNQLLERNLKAYIKTVTCYPERLTKKDYDNVMKEFKHSEKVCYLTAIMKQFGKDQSNSLQFCLYFLLLAVVVHI